MWRLLPNVEKEPDRSRDVDVGEVGFSNRLDGRLALRLELWAFSDCDLFAYLQRGDGFFKFGNKICAMR